MSSGKRNPKHKAAIVSANLEVVSQEKFNKRLEGLSSSCANCQRERAKSRPANNKQKRRRKQAKANTPIVIKLKDTLKAAISQKYPSVPLSPRAFVSSERQKSKSSRAIWDIKNAESKLLDDMSMHSNGGHLHAHHFHQFEKHWSKDDKNFASFLSVIEKAHRKDSSSGVLDWNLDLEGQNKFSNLVLHQDMVLNNEKYSDLYKRDKESSKRRSIVNCENVDLICNDLSNLSDPGTESTEDSEVELSSVLSSSEHQSDSELSVGGESNTFEFSKDELDRLAEYTTGFPLIRYDCPPSECPQCLVAAYSAQYYHEQDSIVEYDDRRTPRSRVKGAVSISLADCYRNSSFSRSSDSDCDETTDSDSTGTHSRRTSNDSIEGHHPFANTQGSTISVSKSVGYRKLEKQLCDIDLVGWKRLKQKSAEESMNSVYIDLTDTDVTFSVYYHHKLPLGKESSTMTPSDISSLPMLSSYTPHMCYHPYYTMPYPSIPTPLYLPTDNSVPKYLMVPPSELQN